jgi:hypothetical protein
MIQKSETIFDERSAGNFLGGEEKPISPRTMQRMRLEGSGPTFMKIGKLVRYQQSDLEDFRRNCRRTSTCDVGSNEPRDPVS